MNNDTAFPPADVVLMPNCPLFCPTVNAIPAFWHVNCDCELHPVDAVLEMNKVF